MGIKAVEMVRKIRDENYKRTSGLSHEVRLRIIHEEAAAFLGKKEKPKPRALYKRSVESSRKTA